MVGTIGGRTEGEGELRFAANARVGMRERPGMTLLKTGGAGPRPLFILSAFVILFIGTPTKVGEASVAQIKRATTARVYKKNFMTVV